MAISPTIARDHAITPQNQGMCCDTKSLKDSMEITPYESSYLTSGPVDHAEDAVAAWYRPIRKVH